MTITSCLCLLTLSTSPIARVSDIGCSGVRVPIIGYRVSALAGVHLARVRDLVTAFLGAAGEDVAPGYRQTEVGMAWEKMYQYIATPGCAEHALALASEMGRRFPIDPLIVAERNGDSVGLFSTRNHNFNQLCGQAFPKVKTWPTVANWAATSGSFLTWLGWYNLGQSGMLPEASFDVEEGSAWPPHYDDLVGVTPSLVVTSASPTFRMARALGLVEGEQMLLPSESRVGLFHLDVRVRGRHCKPHLCGGTLTRVTWASIGWGCLSRGPPTPPLCMSAS